MQARSKRIGQVFADAGYHWRDRRPCVIGAENSVDGRRRAQELPAYFTQLRLNAKDRYSLQALGCDASDAERPVLEGVVTKIIVLTDSAVGRTLSIS